METLWEVLIFIVVPLILLLFGAIIIITLVKAIQILWVL